MRKKTLFCSLTNYNKNKREFFHTDRSPHKYANINLDVDHTDISRLQRNKICVFNRYPWHTS